MALGPGKYDDVCTTAREKTGGGVILIVTGGKLGSGFSCQCDALTLAKLPQMLEEMAAQLRKDRDIVAISRDQR